MDTLYRDILELVERREPFALATVVHTAGSTPQKPGAKAIFRADGQILGTLGGGCMEMEARRRGLELVHGGEPIFFDLHLDDDFGWDDGLICGGTAQIFIQSMCGAAPAVYAAAVELDRKRGRGALATLVKGGPPGSVGEPILIRDDGTTTGALPPAPLGDELVRGALAALETGAETPGRLKLADGAIAYLEPLLPRPTVLIAGAGHVGAALVPFAARVGFDVAVIDDRASLCNRERMPEAAQVIVDDIVKAVREFPKTPDTYIVIVTRGHRHDAVVLREVIHAPVAYIGMIGSRRKILTIYDEFLAEGLATWEELARVHAPIGLDIGGISVEEIALSIAAELVAVRRKRGPHPGHGECPGGREVAVDGNAPAALGARLANRDRDSRPLAATLPTPRAHGR